MEQILIYSSPFVAEPINSHNHVSVITSIEHKKVLLGEDVINMTVESATVRNFAIGNYIQLPGLSRYRLNQLPKVSRLGERKYQYELVFEGLQYDLLRVAYRNTDPSTFNTSADFTLTGNLEMFLNVLINNLNRIFGEDTWALGDFPTGTATKNLVFNNENCLAVLQRLCEEYQYQFVFQEGAPQNKLHIRNVGVPHDFTFRYGQGKGLYQLARENVDSQNIINTLWAYGSDKNLPANYKNYTPRLRVGAGPDMPILDIDSITSYGTFEGSVTFDDIYPHRVGTVSGIVEANRRQFVDAAMDFDLKEKDTAGNTLYLIAGNAAKIRFNSGNLAGYEFEVEDYQHSSRTFTIKPNKDAKGLEMPSATELAFQIQTGDTYVILDITMPPVYVLNAENTLEAKAIEFLNTRAVPTVKYSLEIDEFYLKSLTTATNVFEVGDTVKIQDDDLMIDSRIKITEFTRNLLRPYQYTLTIQESPQTSLIRRIFVQNKVIHNVLRFNGLEDPVKAKTDWRSHTQIIAEIPEYVNNTPQLPIGSNAQQVSIGNSGSETKLYGEFALQAGLMSFYETAENPVGISVRNQANDEIGFFQLDNTQAQWTTDKGLKSEGNNTLGSDASTTEVKGNFKLRNTSNFTGDFLIAENTDNRSYTFPDQNIVINEWGDLSNKPDNFKPDSSYFRTDYGLIGLLDGTNKVFQTSDNFVAGSTRVYLNGVRQFKGEGADYTETGSHEITFALAPDTNDTLITDFIKQ
ncbi:hypothetical protein [Emticicia sp. 17c]|uniref:hypothetical protein n=1 Tax=Emticicia sp. 17c TaxID=3127704 RepID=UPI00301C328B